ncbi:hypothetical protein M3J09_001285 [Ascochyta lentis]
MYSRDECIVAVSDFYDFVGKMFMDVQSSIIYPPSDGWPNMTPEVMGCLGKNEEVISLLRHLPYLEDKPYSERPDCLPNECRPLGWKTTVDNLKDGEEDNEGVLFQTEGQVHRFGDRIPKHCVGLMDVVTESGDGIQNVMLLDVENGLVYWMDCPKHVLEACEPKPSSSVSPLVGEAEAEKGDKADVTGRGDEDESDDKVSDNETETGETETPPTSNDDNDENEEEESEKDEEEEESVSSDYCGVKWGPCWPVRDFFAMLKNHFVKLNWIPYSPRAIIDIWTDETSSGLVIPEGLPQLLQSVYRKHGWPDLEVYKKEECLAELKQVLHEKYPDFH